MKTCMYCGTGVKVVNGASQCDFCQMELDPSEVMNDGERKKSNIKRLISISHMNKPTRELMKMNTYELLCLLQLLRKERTQVYGYLQEVKQMTSEAKGSDAALETLAQARTDVLEQYEYVTRKMWTVENILEERMEAVPKRLSDDFLDKYFAKTQKRNDKPMTFMSATNTKIAN